MYLKRAINEQKNVTDLHLGTNDFEKCYCPTVKLVKNESSDLLADSHKFINMWNYAESREFPPYKKFFSITSFVLFKIGSVKQIISNYKFVMFELI